MKEDVAKYLQNPGCSCNMPFYRRLLKDAHKNLKEYFPGREIDEEAEPIIQNHWTVINCHIDALAAALQKLPPGRKQVAVTRFEDQVTAVINELDF